MSTMLSDLPWHEPTSTGYGALLFCEGLAAHGGGRDSTVTEVAEVLAMHDRDVVELIYIVFGIYHYSSPRQQLNE